jgi:hypothetical protein
MECRAMARMPAVGPRPTMPTSTRPKTRVWMERQASSTPLAASASGARRRQVARRSTPSGRASRAPSSEPRVPMTKVIQVAWASPAQEVGSTSGDPRRAAACRRRCDIRGAARRTRHRGNSAGRIRPPSWPGWPADCAPATARRRRQAAEARRSAAHRPAPARESPAPAECGGRARRARLTASASACSLPVASPASRIGL